MSDSNATPWKVVTGIAVVAALVLGYLWMQGQRGTVAVSVADSLRRENTRLSTTVEELRAAPAETVYAEPPSERRETARLSERIRRQVDNLEAVLPDAESHPAYHRSVRAIRAALDTISND